MTVCYKGFATEEGAMTLIVDVTEVTARLDELLAEAEAGRRVVILRGTEPVAKIEGRPGAEVGLGGVVDTEGRRPPMDLRRERVDVIPMFGVDRFAS